MIFGQKLSLQKALRRYLNLQRLQFASVTIVLGRIFQPYFRELLALEKKKFHMIIEEYDGETLTKDEVSRVNELIKSNNFEPSSIILLSQALKKERKCSVGKKNFERETCMFAELEDLFKIIKLEEVQRCSSEIFKLLSYTQDLVDEKDSVFRTKRGKKTPEKLLDNKDETDETNMDDDGKQNLISLDSTIQNKQSKMYSGIDSNERDEINHRKISLDQAFQNLRATKSKNKGQIKIVSRFSFICSPQQECIIKGTKPNVIEFSEAISSTNEAAVISLGVILKKFIGKNKKTALLYLTSEKPVILRKVLLKTNLLIMLFM